VKESEQSLMVRRSSKQGWAIKKNALEGLGGFQVELQLLGPVLVCLSQQVEGLDRLHIRGVLGRFNEALVLRKKTCFRSPRGGGLKMSDGL